MKKLLSLFLTASLFIGCSNTRIIIGKVTHKEGNNITLDNGYKFKIFDTTGLYIGKEVTFTPSVNRKKINSKKLN